MGMKKSDLLIASHIKLWRVCDEKTERTNLCNCLCLNSLHDKAFDKGLITLDSKLKLIVSKEMKMLKWINRQENSSMDMKENKLIFQINFCRVNHFLDIIMMKSFGGNRYG